MEAIIGPGVSALGSIVSSVGSPNFVIYETTAAPAPTTYTPLSQSFLVAWYDWSDGDSVFSASVTNPSSGSRITGVRDKSATAGHFTASGAVYYTTDEDTGYGAFRVRAADGAAFWDRGSALGNITHVYVLLKRGSDMSGGGDYHFMLGDASAYSWHGGNSLLINSTFDNQDGWLFNNNTGNGNTDPWPTTMSLVSTYDNDGGSQYRYMAQDRALGRYFYGECVLFLAYTGSNPTEGSKAEIRQSIYDHFGITP